ncbi:zf-HC2 domain-containing protein [Hymenobacter guriensis]|uniref:HEAT repeat domain-containing protein n=1 Tax=Hymenobacter guriensis TaxID=2793065 RepID=A0ABS0L398_9BACT|nr:zf-HC2 domain-containing protein [Hymenobacter guriensis]MBG8553862.1 HEAT repeat domain-containing protein [Hymenobacter guriensis]
MHTFTSCDDFEALLPAYADGSLPTAETEQVTAHLAACPTCQLHLRQLRTLSNELGAALPEVPRTAMRTNFLAMLEKQKALLTPAAAAAPTPARVVPLWAAAVASQWLRVAAAVLLVAGGMLLGRNLPSRSGQSAEVAANAPDSPAPAQQLAANLAGTAPRPASASDRIQLVTASGEELTPGDPTVQVLINTLNFDANPNVRIAACEALFRLRADPRVAEAFVHSLPIQTDPNVQITLIEFMVALRDPRAVPPLQRLARRKDALPVVRDQAQAGLGKLI